MIAGEYRVCVTEMMLHALTIPEAKGIDMIASTFPEMGIDTARALYRIELNYRVVDNKLIVEGPYEPPPLYTCKFCGCYTDRDSDQQVAPADYCHPEDHQL